MEEQSVWGYKTWRYHFWLRTLWTTFSWGLGKYAWEAWHIFTNICMMIIIYIIIECSWVSCSLRMTIMSQQWTQDMGLGRISLNPVWPSSASRFQWLYGSVPGQLPLALLQTRNTSLNCLVALPKDKVPDSERVHRPRSACQIPACASVVVSCVFDWALGLKPDSLSQCCLGCGCLSLSWKVIN